MIARLIALLAVLLGCGPVAAQTSDDVDALLDALAIPALITIMHEEGLDYGTTLAADMLPDNGGAGWQNTVARIYDRQGMERIVRQAFAAEFGDADAGPLLTYFTSPAGQKIIALEMDARRAFLSKATEEAAREKFLLLEGDADPRLGLIAAYVAANDLIEYNVAGAMNASFAFYQGLVEGGAVQMSEDDILDELWAQEEDTRQENRVWLFAYFLMAYQSLEDSELQAYIDLSQTPEGQALNRALFAGFDRMYGEISLALGLEIGRRLQSQDL